MSSTIDASILSLSCLYHDRAATTMSMLSDTTAPLDTSGDLSADAWREAAERAAVARDDEFSLSAAGGGRRSSSTAHSAPSPTASANASANASPTASPARSQRGARRPPWRNDFAVADGTILIPPSDDESDRHHHHPLHHHQSMAPNDSVALQTELSTAIRDGIARALADRGIADSTLDHTAGRQPGPGSKGSPTRHDPWTTPPPSRRGSGSHFGGGAATVDGGSRTRNPRDAGSPSDRIIRRGGPYTAPRRGARNEADDVAATTNVQSSSSSSSGATAAAAAAAAALAKASRMAVAGALTELSDTAAREEQAFRAREQQLRVECAAEYGVFDFFFFFFFFF
jgi:hypothetical protein